MIPDWLNSEFWVGVTEMNNYMIHFPNKASPIEKFLGYKPDMNKICWLPVGQLVAYRREDTQRKKRAPAQADGSRVDSMLGQEKWILGFLLGKDRWNTHCRCVIPITSDDFDIKQVNRIARVKNPVIVPMNKECFPTSLQARPRKFNPIHRHS